MVSPDMASLAVYHQLHCLVSLSQHLRVNRTATLREYSEFLSIHVDLTRYFRITFESPTGLQSMGQSFQTISVQAHTFVTALTTYVSHFSVMQMRILKCRAEKRAV